MAKGKTIISDESDDVDVDKLFADLSKGSKAEEEAKVKEAKERETNDAVVAQQTKDRMAIEAERQLTEQMKDAGKPKPTTDKGDFDEKMAHDAKKFDEGEDLVARAKAAAEKAQKTGKPEDVELAAKLSAELDESNHPTVEAVAGPSGTIMSDMTMNEDGYSPPVDITPAVRQQAAAANIQDAEREAKQAEAKLREDPERAALEANAGEPEIDWKDPTVHVDLPTDHAIGPNADQPPDMNAEAMPDPDPGQKHPDHNYRGLRHTRAYLDDEDAEANMSEQTKSEIAAGRAALKDRQKQLEEISKRDKEEYRSLGLDENGNPPNKNTVVARDRSATPRPKKG